MTNFESAFTTTLTKKLNPSDTTISIEDAVTVGRGRIYFTNDTQEEFIKFESTADGGLTLGTLTRKLSTTADPVTGGTGLTWLAGSEVKIVFMHDQHFDKQRPGCVQFATPAARDTALGADGAATEAFANVYVISTGLYYNYNLSTAQWESVDTGNTTPNGSEIVAGKWEGSTVAEQGTAEETGSVGPLVPMNKNLVKSSSGSGDENKIAILNADGNIGNFIPTGLMMMYGAAVAPTGWQLCDGSAISRATYAALFAIIGTTYGVGDGSTTFNVPDLRGNIPVGKDGATFTALGDTGGEETHQLIVSEMPAHTHNIDGGINTSSANTKARFTNDNLGDIPTDSTGGDGSHNNLQPYLVINYIIKT